ncbi:hypothetical protein EGW08_016422 [Elysia chlorotica]|uniref:Uncharacterized protein n=1 Tax=Elysia chlorotica TaxID=188477 RepID=A0A433T2T9_ELYCH|nr:hypothetical protein EGW08_016422 [Elysia chlorotica]
MLVPDSPPHIHQERQRRHSRYRRKSPSPFSVERKGSRCNENLRSELGRQSSPPKKVRIVQDQKTSKSFQHTNIDMGEKRGSICPIKTTPHRSQESKTHMNLEISNVICRRILRKRSFPRDTLSCKDHRRVENLPSEDHSGFVMDKSPDVNRESRARSIGKNTKNESYQNHVLDSRSDMSIPSYKSSIAVSKALPADKERIFLTLNPSPRLIEKPCFVNDENFPTFFDEQKLNQPRFINSGVFRTDTSGNISDNSEYCQNHFPSTDEADFRDKSKSIKHWLNTSSFSKFNVQSNEKLAPDNHVSSKAETSIGTNYFISKSAARGSRHSSQLSAAGLCCDESLLLPALDEGSPQNTAALTAAGLRISSRRSPKGQGSKHHRCSTEGGYRWKTCITNLCALVVVLELIFVTFLWLKDMVSEGKTAFGDMNPNGNESQQNSATPAQ